MHEPEVAQCIANLREKVEPTAALSKRRLLHRRVNDSVRQTATQALCCKLVCDVGGAKRRIYDVFEPPDCGHTRYVKQPMLVVKRRVPCKPDDGAGAILASQRVVQLLCPGKSKARD